MSQFKIKRSTSPMFALFPSGFALSSLFFGGGGEERGLGKERRSVGGGSFGVVVVGHFEPDALVAAFDVEAFVCFGAVEDCLGDFVSLGRAEGGS